MESVRPEVSIHALVALAREVSDAEEPLQVARLLASSVEQHASATGLAVYMVTDDGGVVLAETRGWSVQQLPCVDDLDPDGWIGRLMDLSPSLAAGLASGSPDRLRVLPLASGGGLYGALVLAWEQPPESAAVTLAMGLAETAAIGLDRAYRTRALVRAADALAAKQEEIVRNESLRRMGQLAATVAHEVRNPLASFSGVMQILRSRFPAESEEHKMAGKVLDRLADLNRLVGEILQFARPRQIARAEIDLCVLLRDVVSLARRDPASGGVEIVVACESPMMWMLDAAMMQHLLSNLLQNALSALGGSGQVTIRARHAGADLEISVSDTGPGVPPEIRETLFDPFVTTKVHGSGLGLAMARQVTEAHGGSIRYESSPSGGACFVIRLA